MILLNNFIIIHLVFTITRLQRQVHQAMPVARPFRDFSNIIIGHLLNLRINNKIYFKSFEYLKVYYFIIAIYF